MTVHTQIPWHSRPDALRKLYSTYKELGKVIYAELDPNRRLEGVGLRKARKIVPDLIRDLSHTRLKRLSDLIDQAIYSRRECQKYFLFAPSQKIRGHQAYIDFLEEIKEKLGMSRKDQEALKDTEHEAPQIEVDKKQCEEVGGHQTEGLAQQAREAERRANVDDDDDDGDDALTLDQADFLAFLENLLAFAEEAAAIWTEVAQNKLPIYVASTCE